MTEDEKRKNLLEFCKYYHGEKDNPYKKEPSSMFWEYEKDWLFMLMNDNDPHIEEYMSEYVTTELYNYMFNDGIPISFKALLFDRIRHFGGDISSFKKWYNSYNNNE